MRHLIGNRHALSKMYAMILAVVVVVAAVGSVLYYLQISNTSPQRKEYLIGGTVSLTGATALDGATMMSGLQLAVQRINSLGGINGIPVRLLTYDDGSDAGRVPPLYEKLITVDNVDVVVGPVGTSLTIAALAITEKYKKVMFAPLSVSESTHRTSTGAIANKYYVSEMAMNVTPVSWGSRSAVWNFLVNYPFNASDKPKTVALIAENQAFAVECHKAEATMYAQSGFNVVLDEIYDFGATDFSGLLVKLKATAPDVIEFLGFQSPCIQFTTQLVQQRIPVKWLFVESAGTYMTWVDPKVGVGAIGNGVIGASSPALNPNFHGGDIDWLRVEYNNTYHGTVGGWTIRAFAIIELVTKAIKLAGTTDSDALMKVLREQTIDTAASPCRFTEDGKNLSFNYTLYQWQNGQYLAVYPTSAAASTPTTFKLPST